MQSYKASPYEKLFWYAWLKNKNDPALQLHYVFKLRGKLDLNLFETALKAYVNSYHRECNSYFHQTKEEVFKIVLPPADEILSICNLKTSSLDDILAEFISTPFDLNLGPLFRFQLIKVSKDEHVFACSFSHIIFDGTNYSIFSKFLEDAYKGKFPKTEQADSESLPISKENLNFWKKQLSKKSLNQNLYFLDKKGGPTESFNKVNFKKEKVVIEGSLFVKFKKLLKELDITPFQFILGITSVLIAKYNNVNENTNILIGHTVNISPNKSLGGCWTNLNPLHINYSEEHTPKQLLKAISRLRKKAKPHQHVPLLEIIKTNDQESVYFNNFKVLINHSPGLIDFPAIKLEGIEADTLKSPTTNGPYDFGIIYNITNKALTVEFSIQNITKSHIEEIGESFKNLCDAFCVKTDTPFTLIKLWPSHHIIQGKKSPVMHRDGLVELLKKSFMDNSSSMAVVFKDTSLTYSDLMDRINQTIMVVDEIIESTSNTQIIGIHLERSENLLIAVLLSIFQGYCFVPLDPRYPLERLEYITKTSNIKYILTDKITSKSSIFYEKQKHIFNFIDVGSFAQDLKTPVDYILEASSNNSIQQYILFTSGSTGHPKGVIISQGNLSNFIYSMKDAYICERGDRLLAVTSLNFDISLLELLLPLSVGAGVDIASPDMVDNAHALIERINSYPITCIQATPSTWEILRSVGWQANRPLKILTGGESINSDLASYLLQQGHHVYNMYGPTETTIWSSISQITDPFRISIGIPIQNTDFYILNENKEPCSLGVPGELWIGGSGVGYGYLNVSSEHNFQALPDGKRAYKTGDLVCNFGENYIKFLRRIDSQVKVRGYRIELEEITSTLKKLVECHAAFTVVRKHPEPHLVCFVQSKKEEFDPETIIQELGRSLPDYMLPNSIIPLKNVPLTPNKKADVKYLESTSIDEIIFNYGCSETLLQMEQSTRSSDLVSNKVEALLKIFKDAFDLDLKESDYNKTFGYFGLHSLSFNKLADQINLHFHFSIQPHEFYSYNTFNKLREYIKQDPSFDKQVILSKSLISKFNDNNVAIIGAAARLPSSENLETFWLNIVGAHNAIKTHNRFSLLSDFKAGFIEHIEHFDAPFFQISPLEAAFLDPQQRLLLQVTWKTLEDAGYKPEDLENSRVGVYIATTSQDYFSIQENDFKPIPYTLPGIASSLLSNRISYFFNWHGPSITIDTACSGSLVALERAVNDLKYGLIDYALVGAANIILDQKVSDALQTGNFLSPSYRCATFDESADGYVRGEGVGCVLLRRYEDAVRDGDLCYGLVVSCAENHGGRSHSLTAPNPEAQKALLLQAYKDKDLASRISYIEAHGTGTKLGDPIEVDSLKAAWKELGVWNESQQIGLGSVKTHVGHLEPAAGIASLLKVLLSLKYKKLPANLHFNKLNPYITLENTPFHIIAENEPWESQELRVAGISSFGFGGSNAHVVIQEAPQRALRPSVEKPAYLVSLSAKTKWSFEQQWKNLQTYLKELDKNDPELTLANISYTLNQGRSHFEYRWAWVVSSLAELITQLDKPLPIDQLSEVASKAQVNESLVPWTDTKAYQEQLNKWKELYIQGHALNWESLHQQESKLRLRLPTYPFHTKPFWFEQNREKKPLLLQTENKKDLWIEQNEQNNLAAFIKISRDHVWLKDHVVGGYLMLPGVAHLSLAMQAFETISPAVKVKGFTNVNWLNPIICKDSFVKFQILFSTSDTSIDYKIFENEILYSCGSLLPENHGLQYLKSDIAADEPVFPDKHTHDQQQLYEAFEKSGIKYGQFFRGLAHYPSLFGS